MVGQAGRSDGCPAASQQRGYNATTRRWPGLWTWAAAAATSSIWRSAGRTRREGGIWEAIWGAVGLETEKTAREQCFQARCVGGHRFGFGWLRWKEWHAVTFRGNVTQSESAAGARMLATKMGVSIVARPASFPSREVFNLYRQMSSVSKGSTDKLIKKAEDLLKALKVAPKAEGHEITCIVSKLTSLESGLSDVKATAMLTGSVSFTIFGIIGCVLLSFPKDIQDVRVKGDNNAKLLENNDKKYKKLKRRVVALEKTAGTAEGKTDGPASGPAEAKTTGPAEAKTTGPASGPAEGKRGGWLWPW